MITLPKAEELAEETRRARISNLIMDIRKKASDGDNAIYIRDGLLNLLPSSFVDELVEKGYDVFTTHGGDFCIRWIKE